MTLAVDYCGATTLAPADGWLTIGRDADVIVDDNPYLHRRFLQVGRSDGLWWLLNVGDQLVATVEDEDGRVQARLLPGARLPLVFERTVVRFTAGPTTYELDLCVSEPVFGATSLPGDADEPSAASATVGPVELTADQRLLVVALCEPVLRNDGRPTTVPSSTAAARRLGWTLTKFNRKLDNVCGKLAKVGVPGMHGGPGELASNRRTRLVEHALAVRLVTPDDLGLLDPCPDAAP